MTGDTPDSSGRYAALGIFGTFGGQAITKLDTSYLSPDNLLSLGSSFLDGVDSNGVSFDTASGDTVDIADIAGRFLVSHPAGAADVSPAFTTAPVFSWTYSFTLGGFNDTVTVVTGTTPNSAGDYVAANVFGTFGGQAITGINTSFASADGLLSNGPGFLDGVDGNGVSFNVGGAAANLSDKAGTLNVSLPDGTNAAIAPTDTSNATTSWNYQFTLNGFADNFTIVTTSNSNGASPAALVFGMFGGQAITGLDSSFGAPNNLLSFGAGFVNGVNNNGVSFDEAGGGKTNFFAGTSPNNHVLLFGASGAAVTPTLTTAGVFTWNYSFTLNGFTDSFTVVTQTTPTSNGSFNGFQATGIAGTFHGQAITGLSESAFSSDNTLGFGPSFVDGVDTAGLEFLIAAGPVGLFTSNHIFKVADPVAALTSAVTPTLSTDAACFRSGTRILTRQDNAAVEVAVELLRVGDLVLTAAGRARPVRWLGHRNVRCALHPSPDDVNPVRIAAGAFGPGLPHRDLWLSPDHSVFADGCLIQASLLVNGLNVVQKAVESVQYWHVELDTHDVILAERLPAETYLDTGNRSQFANAPIADLRPDFRRMEVEVAASLACAPIVTGGAVLDAVRSWLAENAAVTARSRAA